MQQQNSIVLKFACLWLISIGLPTALGATDTFERVRSIVQTKCTNGCHNSTTPSGMLIMNGDAPSLYNALVGANPTNPAAQSNGYKRVVPGRADQSFFMKKISNGLEHNFDLQIDEGAAMPPYGAPALTNVEKELIRQWILFGAPQSGEVTNETLIEEFYAAGTPFVQPLPTPNPDEGFQLHHGPIFMAPGEEFEAFRKIDLTLPDSLDIVGFDIAMNPESHHFVIYQYNPTLVNDIPAGVRMSSGFGDEVVMFQNAHFLDIWQFAEPHHIPDIAAFKWGTNTAIDLNYHIKNYSSISVLAAEAYINIYTTPKSNARREMKFIVENYGGINPFSLNIPATATDTTLSFFDTTDDDEWIAIWKMQGHTHRLGKNYNVFLRNADGTKGEHIYYGYYDATHTFNQGYYDYSHPPVLKNEPLMCLNRKNGLIHEATYNNNTGNNIGFGLTTNEEMFVTYYTYLELDPSEVPCEVISSADNPVSHLANPIVIAPNPSNSTFAIQYEHAQSGNLNMQVYNILGEKMADLLKGKQMAGNINLSFDAQHLPSGIYLLHIQTDKGSFVQKMIKE